MAERDEDPAGPVSEGDVLGGRYLLGARLGAGGMAVVHRATDRVLHRPVAVKLLHPHLRADPAVSRRFELEARAAAGLAHPNVVVVHDVGEDSGLAWMVMELVDGGTLADHTGRGPQAPAWVRRVVSEILGGLGSAHAAGLLHRDIKPANVLLTTDGRAKVADFGIVKALDAQDQELTGTGGVLGTGPYLAPERAAGAAASPASDLWSVGVVLHELLTGTRPFGERTPAALVMAASDGTLAPGDAPAGTDRQLLDVARRALAADPAHRWASASAMADALQRDPGPTVRAVPPPPTVLLPAGAAPTAVLPAATPVGPAGPGWSPPPRRRWALAGVVGLAVVAVVALVGALAGSSHPSHAGPAVTTTVVTPSSTAPATTPTTPTAPTTVASTTIAPTTTAPTVPAPAPPGHGKGHGHGGGVGQGGDSQGGD